MKTRKSWLIVGVVVIILVILGTVLNNKSENSKLIKIGFIAPMSGQAAAYGEYSRRAFEIGLEEWNASHDLKIEAVYEDGKCSPADAATAANKLINIDKVNYIMTFCTGETNAVIPITEKNKTILLTSGTTAPNITKGLYVFRNIGSVGGGLPKLTELAYAFNKNIATVSENTDYAISTKDGFKSQFIARGGEVVYDESFNSKDLDFRTIISKLKSAKVPAVFVVVQSLDNSAVLFRQMKELNYHPQIFATEAAISEKALEKYAKEGFVDEVEGGVLVTPSFDRENVKAKTLLNKYETKYGSTKGPVPESYLAAHYDAVYLLGEASLEVGTDSDSVREYLLKNIKNWQGAMGNFSFNEKGDAVTSVIVQTVKDGKIVEVK